jgi:hypothetical protein
MADKEFTVHATKAAAAAIDGLRGKARKSYVAFEVELRKQGCKVAGYRLLAEDGGHSEYCCKRLVEDWRAITTFEPGVVIVVALGRHDDRTFYAELAKTLEIGAAGPRRQEKPGCCGEDGWPGVGSTPAGQVPSTPAIRSPRAQGPGASERSRPALSP